MSSGTCGLPLVSTSDTKNSFMVKPVRMSNRKADLTEIPLVLPRTTSVPVRNILA